MKTILVTGGAGFIGSCFVRRAIAQANYRIINLDVLTYAGNMDNLRDLECNSHYRFIKGNICDKYLLRNLFSEYEIDSIVNFAAESHVDRSIDDSEIFLKTNIIGTQSLLDVARQSWSLNPGDKHCRSYRPGVKFIQISTDEVYGALGPTGQFSEKTPLSPNSPYSASKASADIIAYAYWKTYGMPLCITRCSNNYGPYQFPEKLIPLMITNCMNDKPLPIYGDGLQIRDWLHVSDHCSAIDKVLERGTPGEIYNIGGNNEMSNIEIVQFVVKTLGKSESLITYVKDRPGHDRRYAVDSSKISSELDWTPAYSFEKGLSETIQWYLDNKEWIKRATNGEYSLFYEKMYEQS